MIDQISNEKLSYSLELDLNSLKKAG